MKSRQNNERTAPKKGRTSAKSRTRSGKDLLADLNISASTGKVTQRPKPKTALPRVKTSAQEPKERKAAEPKVIFKKVDESNDGQRLDNFLLSQLKGVPKSLIYRVVRSDELMSTLVCRAETKFVFRRSAIPKKNPNIRHLP